MLSKLIKHEFRATSRIMWPVFLGMLALTALMRFSQLLLNGGDTFPGSYSSSAYCWSSAL